MNLQLHFAQKIIKKSLKLAEIDLFHSNAKIVFFSEKNQDVHFERCYHIQVASSIICGEIVLQKFLCEKSRTKSPGFLIP